MLEKDVISPTHEPIARSAAAVRMRRRPLHLTMTDGTIGELRPVSPGALRVRRYRERRREGIRCLAVEMYEADIAKATARGLLKSDGDAWNVLDAWYASHLSDAAMQWLVDNKVIKLEERGDVGAILGSISAWLEQAGR
jgi:hypothetical protein